MKALKKAHEELLEAWEAAGDDFPPRELAEKAQASLKEAELLLTAFGQEQLMANVVEEYFLNKFKGGGHG